MREAIRNASRMFVKYLYKFQNKTHNHTTGERQGATCTALFFLDEGRVKVYKEFVGRGGEG